MLRRRLPVWWFIILAIVSLGLIFYFSASRRPLYRELLLARAQASNLVSFFNDFGNSLAVLAQSTAIKSRNASTTIKMETFVEQWRKSDLIGGVVLTDSRGVVQFNANVLGIPDVGKSLADRDYFVWAKNQTQAERYFVSRPVVSRLGASKGEAIVVVALPVFQNGTFSGVVAASVILAPLTNRYLELMKISSLTEVYLIDQKGNLWYSRDDTKTVGASIFESFPKYPLQTVLNAKKEGKFVTAYWDTGIGPAVRFAAYVPIQLNGQNWLLIVVSPLRDVFSFWGQNTLLK